VAFDLWSWRRRGGSKCGSAAQNRGRIENVKFDCLVSPGSTIYKKRRSKTCKAVTPSSLSIPSRNNDRESELPWFSRCRLQRMERCLLEYPSSGGKSPGGAGRPVWISDAHPEQPNMGYHIRPMQPNVQHNRHSFGTISLLLLGSGPDRRQSAYWDFTSFSGAMTNYLLPWIALTAQLPAENGTPFDVFMSFCLSLGSPALITYSLMITLLNRIWIHGKFGTLIDRTKLKKVQRRYPEFTERVECVLYFLSESQQAPLRVTQTKYWLSSLVVSPMNQDWWVGLRDRLQRSRRDYTSSLFAQIALAGAVWLFTIISAFYAAWGDVTVALQIAAATLWTWLVRFSAPLCFVLIL
jgi:hypothetical protein